MSAEGRKGGKMGVFFGPEVGEGSNPGCLISHVDSAQFPEATVPGSSVAGVATSPSALSELCRWSRRNEGRSGDSRLEADLVSEHCLFQVLSYFFKVSKLFGWIG